MHVIFQMITCLISNLLQSRLCFTRSVADSVGLFADVVGFQALDSDKQGSFPGFWAGGHTATEAEGTALPLTLPQGAGDKKAFAPSKEGITPTDSPLHCLSRTPSCGSMPGLCRCAIMK